MNRTAAALVAILCATVFACAHAPAPSFQEPVAAAPAALFSEPIEYQERPVSAEAGAMYFGETGLGDPHAAGLPYPVLLAMMRAYPSALGEDWVAFSAKFGALPRDPSSGDRTALPVGFHLTTDPTTHVAFVMNNCELCHAERLHLPQGRGQARHLVSGRRFARWRLRRLRALATSSSRRTPPTISTPWAWRRAPGVARRSRAGSICTTRTRRASACKATRSSPIWGRTLLRSSST